MNKKIILAIIFAITILAYGCNEDSILGLNFLPEKDILNLQINDTTTINVFTVEDDSLETNSPNHFLLGIYNDPIFGRTKASFATQVLLNSSSTFHPINLDGIADSLVIYLALDTLLDENTYGKGESITVNVYKLTKPLVNTEIYYSNDNPDDFHLSEPIGTSVLTSNTSTLSIKLSNSIAQSLIDNSSTYFSVSDTLTFQEIFYGFYFEVVDNSSSDGIIARINPNASATKMTLYYVPETADSTYTYNFAISSSGISVNFFSHTFSEELNNSLTNQTIQDSVAYLQSMGGTKIKLEFPYLANYKNITNMAINKAELVVKTENELLTSESDYPAVQKMAIVAYDSENNLVLLDEFQYSSIYTGYEYKNNEYRFLITRQIESFINSEADGINLYLISLERRYNFGRSVITTGKHSNSMKLIITSTEY